ncbi:hypothetical protein [Actinoplanes rectilineatus]|uniref:hypothetical protein n=1 Tax=Actinoplanes rectilineatus TaxID=113571 RepID=UPI0005F2D993|nr:hypothetical protein [Actinoplanes rectilineatus]
MSDLICVICEQPTADGYGCHRCATRRAELLREIADMVTAARDEAHGVAQHGGSVGGGGKPGSRPPLDFTATAKLDGVQNEITTWLRHIGETRGPHVVAEALNPRLHPDPLGRACLALSRNLEWARHRPEINDLVADVDAAHRIVRGIARGPAAQRYLGPCGAVRIIERSQLSAPPGAHLVEAAMCSDPCEGDVYGPDGGRLGWCRTCGEAYDQGERQAEMAKLTHGKAYQAQHIAAAHGISADTIRSWARRGRLRSWWWDGEEMQLWIDPAVAKGLNDEQRAAREAEIEAEIRVRGPRLHVVADVLELAEQVAQQRAAAEARRAAQTAEMGV